MAENKHAPTHEDFQKCAQVAHEFNELIALGELGPLLERENDHSYLCQVGVWYWQLGHRTLATACYRRSLEIHPAGPTYFNLAVCLDDLARELHGDSDINTDAHKQYAAQAIDAIRSCYALTTCAEERSSVRAMLMQNGKNHLAKAGG